MNTLKYIGIAGLTILAIDCVGFMLWALSGQFPTDNFYVGTITKALYGIFF